LLFGGLIRYGGRWIPASWIADAPEGAVPLPMDPEMAFGLPPGSMSRNAPDIPQCKGINNAAEGIFENQNHLFGHNEYIVRDRDKVEKVKQGLLDFYYMHADKPRIRCVDNLTVGGRKGTAVIDTETGLIQLDRSLLDPKWRHLHDGYLLEELHHFHQLYTRGWLGRPLTEAEHELIENEVVRRLLKSGLEIFDPLGG